MKIVKGSSETSFRVGGSSALIRFQEAESESIEIGSGWVGDIAQPAAIGDPSDFAYEGKPVAQWVEIPYETYGGLTSVGIVAFHANGIDRVEFYAENGPAFTVTSPTVRDGETWPTYSADIDLDNWESSEPIEIRAIVYPENAGTPRVMQGDMFQRNVQTVMLQRNNDKSLHLLSLNSTRKTSFYVDLDGSDTNDGSKFSPFLTVSKALLAVKAHIPLNEDNPSQSYDIVLTSGQTFVLTNVDLTSGINTASFVTIRSSDPLNKATMVVPNDFQWRPNVDKLRIKSVQIELNRAIAEGFTDYARMFVIEDCSIIAEEVSLSSGICGGKYFIFAVDTTIEPLPDGSTANYTTLNSFLNATQIRGCVSNDQTGDFAQYSSCILGCEVINPIYYAGAHPDVWQVQFGSDFENKLCCGLRVSEGGSPQVIFSGIVPSSTSTASNCAVVNVNALNGSLSQWFGPGDHILFIGNTIHLNLTSFTQNDQFSLSDNYYLADNLFKALNYGDSSRDGFDSKLVAERNHFDVANGSDAYGTSTSTTDDVFYEGLGETSPNFTDGVANTECAALSRTATPAVICYQDGTLRGTTYSVGHMPCIT